MSAKSQHNNILLAILGFASVVILVAVIGYFTLGKDEDIIQGEVDVSEYRVACKLPGRITDIKVKEGDYVHKGQVLAVLSIPEMNAQENVAKAAAGATEALSDLVEEPNRQELITAAYNVYQQAITANDIAGKTYGRLLRLFNEGVISAQKRDEAEAAYKTTQSAVDVARAQYDLAKSGKRKETKQAAKKQAQAARSAVDVVRSFLKETVQRATADGEVSTIYPKVGELVGLGSPIMSIAMTNDVWVTFNIREDQLNGMKVGTKLKGFLPAFNKNIDLQVTSVKDQGSYAVWKATKANGQYDLKTFEVKAKPITKVDGMRPGMSVILKK